MILPNARPLAAVALTVLGVWCAIQALLQLAFFASWAFREGAHLAPEGFAPFLIYAAAAITLIGFRERLSGSLFADSPPAAAEFQVEPVQSFLIALLGLWFLVEVLVGGFTAEAQRLNFSTSLAELGPPDLGHVLLSGDAWVSRVPHLVRLAAGLVLFLYSGSIARAWRAARGAGRGQHDELAA